MSMYNKYVLFLIGCILFCWSIPFLMADTVVRFPTENTTLLDNRPQDFYMYVDRNFEGKKSRPWQAGTYGFTRTLVRTQAGPVATKFHEGIDIKPLKTDASKKPLDDVRPVAGGVVVHVSSNPTHSNYGRYVVIEHQLPDGPLYSLYAHLASVSCKTGDQVGTGNVIGRLGYSGAGLNKTRAHLHLELCLKLQDDFENWYSSLKLGTPNRHGVYNGLNLAGFDPALVLMRCKDGVEFSLSRHISALPVQYVVRVPSNGNVPNLVKRYPFMLKPGPERPKSWEISFTGAGVPVSATPSDRPCTEPAVIKAVPHPFSQLYRTCNRVSGSSREPGLTASGKRYIRLIFMGAES